MYSKQVNVIHDNIIKHMILYNYCNVNVNIFMLTTILLCVMNHLWDVYRGYNSVHATLHQEFSRLCYPVCINVLIDFFLGFLLFMCVCVCRWAVTPVWCVMMTTQCVSLWSAESSASMSLCLQRWRSSLLSIKVSFNSVDSVMFSVCVAGFVDLLVNSLYQPLPALFVWCIAS